MPDALILGIESSCDETAAAVVRSGEEVLSSVVASQFGAHQPYGGVVPELAAREHLRAIAPVVRKALQDGGVTLDDIAAIAVTQGPGLAGALLVGITYAKALAFMADKPVIAVNHLEGHIHAVLLEERGRGNRELQFPVVALVVSGGHTHLYLVSRSDAAGANWRYRNIGHTRDDAAGEAFDKVAKLLGLGYPGGPVIEALAAHGDPQAVKFPPAQLKHPAREGAAKKPARAADNPVVDFSYSGIKTAVLRYVETHGMEPAIAIRLAALAQIEKPAVEDYLRACDQQTLDLVASFQHGMIEDIVGKTIRAVTELDAATLIVTGGVASNEGLRRRFRERSEERGIRVYFPSRTLSTDNAAMIAAAAYPKLLAEEFAGIEFSAEASLALG